MDPSKFELKNYPTINTADKWFMFVMGALVGSSISFLVVAASGSLIK